MPIKVFFVLFIILLNPSLYGDDSVHRDEQEEVSSEIKDPKKTWFFSYSPEFYEYQFSDSSDSPGLETNNLGHGTEVAYHHWITKSWGWDASLFHRFFVFNDLPERTFPNSLSGNFVQASLRFKIKVHKKSFYSGGLSLYAQYQFSLLDAELTIPLSMGDYTNHALGFGVIYQHIFSNKKRLELDFSFSPSIEHKEEQPAISGKFDGSLNLSGKINYIIPWNESWDLSFGYAYHLRKIDFIGNGSRGSIDAKQKEIVHAPRLGLIYAL